MYTAKDLREKTVEELNNVLHDLLKDQFNYRVQKATGQLETEFQEIRIYKGCP